MVFGENNIDIYRNYTLNNSRALLSQSINICHLPCLNNSSVCPYTDTQPPSASRNFTFDITSDYYSTSADLSATASTTEAVVTAASIPSDEVVIDSVESTAIHEVEKSSLFGCCFWVGKQS